MFSSMIQNLISSSGQSSAMQRAVQMNNYVNSINAQFAPASKGVEEIKTEKPSFDKVLQSTAKTKFGDLLTNPTTRVNAQIYSNTASSEVKRADYSSKSKIKD